MKKNMVLTGFCCGLFLSIVLLPGCATTGTQRSEKTVASADVLYEEYGRLKGQVDKTVQALDGLVAARGTGLKPAYDSYVTEFKKLESQTKVVVKRSKDLKAHTKDYVAAWKKQMTAIENPEIRKHAEQRLTQAEGQLSEARDELARIGTDFETLMGDLRQINIVLENDLNPMGVKSLTGIIQTAKSNVKPVMKDMATIMEALSGISEALSPGG